MGWGELLIHWDMPSSSCQAPYWGPPHRELRLLRVWTHYTFCSQASVQLLQLDRWGTETGGDRGPKQTPTAKVGDTEGTGGGWRRMPPTRTQPE